MKNNKLYNYLIKDLKKIKEIKPKTFYLVAPKNSSFWKLLENYENN